ncbi:cell wall anchor protein [Luteirhabdus pelagi]|uniref:cell wall anchor protein n=1 Tax=Luteirhabdus pelagi TaxID=2792783 RepID=UPI001939CC4B|nr:cell wall anchor protein [Luteirhabdus pelagi]
MKTITRLLLLLAVIPMAYSQVGIGTTNPDPSAMLEIESTEHGFLAPRMTTVQRNNISSPAESLFVYDTDEDAFFYYDTASSSWIRLLADDVKRDNYKLVKSVADLNEELTAGGGSTYQLQTNYLYEINGAITLDFPIDMNGAYIEGVDVGQDILINGSGGTLFQGGSGSIRNVTINGNGNQVFNLSGGGNLVINSSIIAGASSVGTLTGLNVVFFNVVQYVNNTDGFDVSDITSFFMQNAFWTTTNTGTFLNLSGTFSNFQIANGRIVSETGETGIDVSSNPSITNDASISEISFIGDGTRINGFNPEPYTGYNFPVGWDVRSSGVPLETDDVAAGNFYFTGSLTTGFSQTIGNGTAREIEGGTFSTDNLFRFNSAGGNRLIYQGEKARSFQVNASLSIRVIGATSDFYTFVLAKNGTLITESNATVRITNDSDIQNVALNAVTNLQTGDYIEVFVQRLTGSGNDTLVVFSENLSIK